MATRGNTTTKTKARTSSGDVGRVSDGGPDDDGSCLGTTVRMVQGCSRGHVNTSESDAPHDHGVRELMERMEDGNRIHVRSKVTRSREASGQNRTSAGDDDGEGGKVTGVEEYHCCCCCCYCRCLRGECMTILAGRATVRKDATKGRIRVRAG